MEKALYRIVDSRGRVYLPVESRVAAGISPGDIIRLEARPGQLIAHKVELIEIGDKSPESLAAYIMAGVPHLTNGQLHEVIKRVLNCIETKNQSGGNEA